MVRVVRLERTVSWSQTRRDTNFAIPGYSFFCHDTTENGKNKVFSVCGHSCGQSRFCAAFSNRGKSRKCRRRKALRRFALLCSGYRHGTPKASALPTALHPEIFSFAPTILAQLLTFLPACLARPACGSRKNPRAIRLLDFFDRGACFASLHPPPAALGFAPQSAGATNCATPRYI